MIEFGSPTYWVVSLAVFVGLLVGMYFYVTFFWFTVEPAIKARVEARLGVTIHYTLFHFWTIDRESWASYEGNRLGLWATVHGLYFVVLFVFVAVLILALAALWVLLAWLFRGTG